MLCNVFSGLLKKSELLVGRFAHSGLVFLAYGMHSTSASACVETRLVLRDDTVPRESTQ